MPKRPEINLRSFGIYDGWQADAKTLPKIREFTTEIPAEVDIEFGMIVNIKGAKNQKLQFCIDHPGIRNDEGHVRAPFDGEVYVKTNDWDFYLGDTVWEPIDDKCGEWHLSLELAGKVIAEKTFLVSKNS